MSLHRSFPRRVITRLRGRGHPLLAGALLAVALAPALSAQGWYRDAFLGPMTAASFESEAPKGVVKLGPVVIDVFAQGELAYSSNVLLNPVAQAGWEVRYGAGFDAVWQAARDQQLKLTGELSQVHTLSGPARNRTYLTLEPGSAIRYTAYVKDIRIMPFLNLTRQMDPIAAPTVNNTATFEQSSYDLGIQVDWPLRLNTVQVMALRGWKATESDTMERATTDREVLSGRLLHTFSAALDLGVDGYLIWQDFKNGPAEANDQQSASVFTRWALSNTTQLKLALGVNRFQFDTPLLGEDQVDANAWFGELLFSHRLRPNLQYTLRLAQTQSDGVTSNFYETREISLRPSLKLSDRSTLRLEGAWLRVLESLVGGERGTRYVLGAGLEFNLPARLLLRLNARDLRKQSNLPNRVYRERTFDVSLRKQF